MARSTTWPSVAAPDGVTDPDTDNNDATDSTTVSVGQALVAYYAMEEGSGAALIDSSAYGNDATLNGDPTWVPGNGLALALE